VQGEEALAAAERGWRHRDGGEGPGLEVKLAAGDRAVTLR
jgi:hypothetical protein